MSNEFSPNALAGSWLAAVGVVVASALVAGVKVDVSATAMLLALSLIPPSIILLVARRSALDTQAVPAINNARV